MSANYFLTSRRIGFREWNLGDINHAIEIWQDTEVTKFIGGPLSVAKIHSRLVTENRLLRLYGVQYWPMFHKETNEFIGCCGLRPSKPSEKIYELGFYIKPKFWNTDFATEAIQTIMDHAFTQLNATVLIGVHHPDDVIAKEVFESLAFQYVQDEFYESTKSQHRSYMLQYQDYCNFCVR